MSAPLPAASADAYLRENDERAMRSALEAARRAGLAGEPPIGACLARSGELIATAANAVISTLDVTAHAEVALLREACRRLRTLDLRGHDLYVTVEPCPMCLAAAHYAGIGRIVYGAHLSDLHAITGAELSPAGMPAGMLVVGGCLRDESLALLKSWAGGRRR